jgi:hypothetical protein
VVGFVWEDIFLNGKLDGHEGSEPGVIGQTVYADYNNNRRLDAGEPRVLTDEDGHYQLQGLDAGNYPVRQVIGQQWNQSFPLQDHGHWVNLTANQTASFLDFGAYKKVGAVGGVFGRVFQDNNGNGVKDGSDKWLKNRTVFVDYDGDKKMDANEPRALSLSDGKFQINNVRSSDAGRFPVRQIIPNGWEQTAPTGGSWYPTTYNTTPIVGAAAWVVVRPGAVSGLGIAGSGQSPLLGSRPFARTLTIKAYTDTTVRGDWDVRMNDNHGVEDELTVGVDRYVNGWGAPDAMRTLLRFNVKNLFAPRGITSAKLQLTVRGALNAPPSLQLDANRLLDYWEEGNGSEHGNIPGSTNVDDALGVDWLSQPAFDATPVASVTVNHEVTGGEKVELDITPLVRQWMSGSWEGVVIRNPVNGFGAVDPGGEWGRFYQVAFWSKEGEQFLGGVGPRLIITRA